MQTNNDRISLQELAKMVETALIASAKEAECISKATNTPLISLDDAYQPHQQVGAGVKVQQNTQA